MTTLLANRHREQARSQAPAWERTAMEALPPESIANDSSAGRACNSLGSQAEPVNQKVVISEKY